MPANIRATNEQIIAAYKETGNVWKAAKRLGLCGQSVWERLKRLEFVMPSANWTAEEIAELNLIAGECTIGEIARRLGRTYAGVACKISELGIGVRYGGKLKRKSTRGSGLTKSVMDRHFKELASWGGSLRQFCVQRGIDIETFVQAAQKYKAEAWSEYTKAHSELEQKDCPQCGANFIPMNGKQATCSRKCSVSRRVDNKYFGGRRSFAIGIREGVCQLCERDRPSLSAHHVWGKENDTDNEYLVALCPGCHQIVGWLGARSDVQKTEFWENLIGLAVARKNGPRKPIGFHVCVDIEELDETDLETAVVMEQEVVV